MSPKYVRAKHSIDAGLRQYSYPPTTNGEDRIRPVGSERSKRRVFALWFTRNNGIAR